MGKNYKDESGFNLPNCGSHVKRDDSIEKISKSIRLGFESLSNSLVECALILSSEDYAKSLVKEWEAKKKEKEETKKKDEEKKKKMKENSVKVIDLFKQKLKDQIFSIENISDDEKNKIFNLFITNRPTFDSMTSIKSISGLSINVKKAFSDAIKELKPEFAALFNEQVNFDPMLLSMSLPYVEIPPLSFMALTLGDGKTLPDPMTFMMMNGTNGDMNFLPFLMMNANSK